MKSKTRSIDWLNHRSSERNVVDRGLEEQVLNRRNLSKEAKKRRKRALFPNANANGVLRLIKERKREVGFIENQ